MAAFRYRTRVMFQHCDPAGIVFYPRYFEMVNEVVETFFDEAVGWSFRQMHAVERVGVPMGRIETEFLAASRLGDLLDWTFRISRLGGASLDFDLSAVCAGEERLVVTGTLVLVDLDAMKSMPWPATHRAALETCREE